MQPSAVLTCMAHNEKRSRGGDRFMPQPHGLSQACSRGVALATSQGLPVSLGHPHFAHAPHCADAFATAAAPSGSWKRRQRQHRCRKPFSRGQKIGNFRAHTDTTDAKLVVGLQSSGGAVAV